MPRRARLMLAGIPVHITHRGNNRQRCFYAESDYAFYLFHLRRLLPHSQCRLHTYCLMSNHVHLLLTPQKVDSCARLMKYLAQLHTQYMNRNYQRSGTLWEGRFNSSLVQSENYLLSCRRGDHSTRRVSATWRHRRYAASCVPRVACCSIAAANAGRNRPGNER
jgi:putative transposase